MSEAKEDPVRRLWRLWDQGERPDLTAFLAEVGPLEPLDLAAVLCMDRRLRWLAGQRIPAEYYLRAYPAVAANEEAALDLVYFEYRLRQEQGEAVAPDEFLLRFPQYAEQLQLQIEVGDVAPDSTPPDPGPQHIGRYRVAGVLGEGAFGRVYLAYDDQLNRAVAIKVPHRRRLSSPEDAEAYLAEARVLASLDHPSVVPVHDVGATADGLCYVVSKFIEGSDLAQKIKQGRLSLREAAELTATVAEALHYAHRKGLVHRDVKPANLLIDAAGKPYVADFGLALKEEDFGKGTAFAGTPAYMSPEQARGEGHRVDGRSDIFSLGVVFYELLTGRRPFQGETQAELLEQITTVEARPLRQVDDTIPKEVERICLKALSKRASERFTTAKDLADDLKHFLAQAAEQDPSTRRPGVPATATPATPSAPITPVGSSSDRRPLKIVPKGLRSFDAHDADFFLELLPGPRDRDGLPDSIRFWKTRIEEKDPDRMYSVGLIYGPSGCGKSSLMKAGLLPRLAGSVLVVYVEATGEETEARLLRGLRRQAAGLPDNLGLAESLTELRRGRFLQSDQRVLLVLDQFEQWLHARRSAVNTELEQALRQCDGSRVQAVVMVRDDFWMAATRFMANLEISLVQGRNCAAVDLFDPRHARKVLTAFGRAFGALPEQESRTKDQDAFLDQAVAGLARAGKVVSVRLTLFAEMMKGRPWTPAALREVGGTEGVGVTFLEETFAASTAPPPHRVHQKAAQAVLKALLPEAGSDIKGHMRSQQELLEASGYSGRPREFDDLLRILDGELRLITPTDPEGAEGESSSPPPTAGGRYYQLTHDYLVPSLRDWLTRKQKETRRGRAELRLAERVAAWNAKPENRLLPAGWEWLNIRLFTRRKDWTSSQRKMMRRAGRYHAERGVLLALLLVVLIGAGLGVLVQSAHRNRADYLVQQLRVADVGRTPDLIRELDGCRYWAEPALQAAYDKAKNSGNHDWQVNLALALLPEDEGRVDYLYTRFLDADPPEAALILWRLAETGRLRANQGSEAVLLNELMKSLDAEKTEEKERLAKRQANAAVALFRMNRPEKVWPLLKRSPDPDDPRVRSYLIHRLSPLGADAGAIIKRLDEETDVTIHRALFLSLGEFDDNELPPETRNALLPKLQAIYRTASDPGLHAAADWLLGRWKQEAWLKQVNEEWTKDREQREKRLDGIKEALAKDKEKTPPQWYVNGHGQTMIVIPGPVEFMMGSPPTEADRENDEIQHRKRIGRTFALAAKSVTGEQYQQFDKDYNAPPKFTRMADLPVVEIDWYMAAKYCNWLSEEEGVPEKQRCYEIKGDEITLKANYLSLSGYRLPTEAEMEYATRAGALTSRYFGEAEDLLPKYARYSKNSQEKTWPVGSLKPNDMGLFDVQGNVWTWCQESYNAYPQGEESSDDKEDDLRIVSTRSRVLRGGSFLYLASYVRSAFRSDYVPSYRSYGVGFRLAQTLPLVPLTALPPPPEGGRK